MQMAILPIDEIFGFDEEGAGEIAERLLCRCRAY